eukprot:1077-Heterococcus_DN1.PRE.1
MSRASMRHSSVTTRVSSTLTGLAPAPVLLAAALLKAAAAAATAVAMRAALGLLCGEHTGEHAAELAAERITAGAVMVTVRARRSRGSTTTSNSPVVWNM